MTTGMFMLRFSVVDIMPQENATTRWVAIVLETGRCGIDISNYSLGDTACRLPLRKIARN